jgi:glycyl-tRNA synthetase beta chain
MPNLLFECFSEEMPARMQSGAREQLTRLVTKALADAHVSHGPVATYASPRHLAIRIEGLPEMQPDVTTEKKGPKQGAPEQAIKGFLQGAGLASLEQCELRQVGKDQVYFVTVTTRGRPIAELLKDVLEQVMRDFVWPKSMRWGARALQWVRPLHRMLCLLDDAVIPVTFGHIVAGNVTEGHRFLAPDPITLAHADNYVSALEKAQVMVDAERRKASILEQAQKLAASQQLTLREDAGLLEEVTGLVEWPFCQLGRFDAHFMHLPPEVLVSEMRNHQKYFALQQADGKLAPQFIITANMQCADAGKAIAEGNARVVRARLADGEFYWAQDRKMKLDEWGAKLKDVVFHAKVGMMDAKAARIVALAEKIATDIGFQDKASVKRAAELCKADLTTGMVGEFPELQGIMGRYYALEQGEKPVIADAIRDHYKPVGADDSADNYPNNEVGAVVAIADKLDSIVSLFAAGEKPTGSKDPLALRRAALGVLRILRKHGWNLDIAAYADSEVVAFFRDRLKQLLRDDNIPTHIVEACLSAGSGEFKPAKIAAQTHDTDKWLETPEGKATMAALKRVLNILAAEEKKQKTNFAPQAGLKFTDSDTHAAALHKAVSEMPPVGRAKDLNVLANPIEAFFTHCLVNIEDADLRAQRLDMLARIREKSCAIADFSLIEG